MPPDLTGSTWQTCQIQLHTLALSSDDACNQASHDTNTLPGQPSFTLGSVLIRPYTSCIPPSFIIPHDAPNSIFCCLASLFSLMIGFNACTVLLIVRLALF